MQPLSYRLVPADGPPVQGTDYTGVHQSAAEFADWHRENSPSLVEVSVWAGELAQRPDHALELLREAVARPSSGDAFEGRRRAYRGAVALDVLDPRPVA